MMVRRVDCRSLPIATVLQCPRQIARQSWNEETAAELEKLAAECDRTAGQAAPAAGPDGPCTDKVPPANPAGFSSRLNPFTKYPRLFG